MKLSTTLKKHKERVRKSKTRRRTNVKDIGNRIARFEMRWAGHLYNRGDRSWSKASAAKSK